MANPQAIVPTGSIDRPAFGTKDFTIKSVNAFEFEGFLPSDPVMPNFSGSRWVAGGSGFMDAPLSLPSGARIEAIELMACDSNTAGQVTLTLFSNTLAQFGEPIVAHGSVGTGVNAAPGCQWFHSSITPLTVDNSQRSYFLEVSTDPKDGSVRLTAANVY